MKRHLQVLLHFALLAAVISFVAGCEGDNEDLPEINLTGTWTLQIEGDMVLDAVLTLEQTKLSVTGSVFFAAEEVTGTVNGIVDGNSVTLMINAPWGAGMLNGAVSTDQMGGTWTGSEDLNGVWSATRR